MHNFIPPVHIAAYTALVLALVTFGLAVAALSISLIALLDEIHRVVN